MTICSDRSSRIFTAIEMFHKMTSANSNSTTLYHGIDDLLRDKIPEFMKDNASYEQLALLEKWGFDK